MYIFGGMRTVPGQPGLRLGVDEVWALDCAKHAKGENSGGAAWEKPAMAQPPNGFFGSIACASGNYLAVAGGVKEVRNGNVVRNKDVNIFDLTKDAGSAAQAYYGFITGFLGEVVCKGDKMYLRFNDGAGTCETWEVFMGTPALSLKRHANAPGGNCDDLGLMVQDGEVSMAGDGANIQGWKFMSCSHCQEVCQQVSWLLIGCTKVNNQSKARSTR